MELEGNTHAEENAFKKFAEQNKVSEDHMGDILPKETVLYTTLEPCVRRLSGKKSCVERILETLKGNEKEEEKWGGIRRVYVGLKEPDRFVKDNDGLEKLKETGVECIVMEGFEEEIRRVAMAGHEKS